MLSSENDKILNYGIVLYSIPKNSANLSPNSPSKRDSVIITFPLSVLAAKFKFYLAVSLSVLFVVKRIKADFPSSKILAADS